MSAAKRTKSDDPATYVLELVGPGSLPESVRLVLNARLLQLGVETASRSLVVVVAGSSGNNGGSGSNSNSGSGISGSTNGRSGVSFNCELPKRLNELWDLALEAGKASSLRVAVVATPTRELILRSWGKGKKVGIENQHQQEKDYTREGVERIVVLNVGKSLDPECLNTEKAAELTEICGYPVEIRSLEEMVVEETRGVPYLLFDEPGASIQKFRRVVLGGTFDHMHNGHRLLLGIAAEMCLEKIVVGVTGDEMLKNKKFASVLEPIGVRMQNVRDYLSLLFAASTPPDTPKRGIEIVEINDPYGPTVSEEDLDAIVVSSETLKGARIINELREKKNFKPLIVVAVQRSNVYTLSSTFVRHMIMSSI